jgi:hypothetical protein
MIVEKMIMDNVTIYKMTVDKINTFVQFGFNLRMNVDAFKSNSQLIY